MSSSALTSFMMLNKIQIYAFIFSLVLESTAVKTISKSLIVTNLTLGTLSFKDLANEGRMNSEIWVEFKYLAQS